ncbi:MAG: AAA family ATPase [Bacteroidales bacterium]|jgi:MoxR-like ATPase|nr:MoxR family ATPase [Bacteroidales bacterium]
MENTTMNNNKPDVKAVLEIATALRNAISKHVMGNADTVDMLIAALLADGHVLIEGVPGIGKTLTARLLSASVSGSFSRIQFTPDLMPADLIGTMIFNAQSREFEYKKGPVFSHVVLIDEINRAPAKTQSALFEAMEERQISMEGITYPLPSPFLVVATQNPVEYEGTYRLPEAQLDRFMFKIKMGYPDEKAEIDMLINQSENQVWSVKMNQVADSATILEIRKIVKEITFSQKLMEYLVNIMQRTRHSSSVYLGGSPRATLNAMQAAKAIAAMNGRDYVNPDDIRYVLPSVLRHRILLTSEKEMEGVGVDDLIIQMMNMIEVPR